MRNNASKASGSPLVATPVIDKNGRLTTVHKRSDNASFGSPALTVARPSIVKTQKAEAVHTIKPKKLADDSPAARIGLAMHHWDGYSEESAFIAGRGRKPVDMADDVLFDFLREGIDTQNAAALNTFGISEVGEIPDGAWGKSYPGSLSTVITKSTLIHYREFGQVIERLQEAGLSAVDASKAISNGLQDGHLDQALSDEQLLKLFSKWNYKSTFSLNGKSETEQDKVIDGFVSGLIPFELASQNMNTLKGLEYELTALLVKEQTRDDEDKALLEKLKDRDYLVTLGSKFHAMIGSRPLRELNRLVENHGIEVLDLEQPQLAGVSVRQGEGKDAQIGIEGAKYIQTVQDIAHEQSDRAYWTSVDRYNNVGGLEVDRSYLRNYELNNLREAGVSPEKAYDMLINHKLTPEQIVVAHQTGLNSSLAQGAL